MVQPIVAPPIPSNAVLPTQVTPRPIEQEREQGVRGTSPEAVTTSQDGEETQAQDSRSDALQSAAGRVTGEEQQRTGRGATVDILA